jgi:prevent-host-death family protein
MIASLRDSKARLSELVARAAGGEPVLITVRGRPKARLVAVEPTKTSLDMPGWVEELAVLQNRHSVLPVKGSSVLDDIREDRC